MIIKQKNLGSLNSQVIWSVALEIFLECFKRTSLRLLSLVLPVLVSSDTVIGLRERDSWT